MEDYGRYQWNQNQDQEEPQNPPVYQPENKKKPNHTKKSAWAKKIGAIALSGVLFGGIAGGVFTGVAYGSGAVGKYNAAQNTSAQNTSDTGDNTATLQTASAVSNGTTDSQSLDVSDIAEGVMPSIVAISNKSVQEVQSYFSMFGRGTAVQEQEVESQGSGIIIGQNEEELLIATNNHVVADADTLSACFIDDQAYEATVK